MIKSEIYNLLSLIPWNNGSTVNCCHMNMHVYLCIYIYIYIHIYVCIYIYIYIYIYMWVEAIFYYELSRPALAMNIHLLWQSFIASGKHQFRLTCEIDAWRPLNNV